MNASRKGISVKLKILLGVLFITAMFGASKYKDVSSHIAVTIEPEAPPVVPLVAPPPDTNDNVPVAEVARVDEIETAESAPEKVTKTSSKIRDIERELRVNEKSVADAGKKLSKAKIDLVQCETQISTNGMRAADILQQISDANSIINKCQLYFDDAEARAHDLFRRGGNTYKRATDIRDRARQSLNNAISNRNGYQKSLATLNTERVALLKNQTNITYNVRVLTDKIEILTRRAETLNEKAAK